MIIYQQINNKLQYQTPPFPIKSYINLTVDSTPIISKLHLILFTILEILMISLIIQKFPQVTLNSLQAQFYNHYQHSIHQITKQKSIQIMQII